MQRQELLACKQIVVLPYYLFTGTLVTRIARQMQHLRAQYPLLRFAQGHYFGFEFKILECVIVHRTHVKQMRTLAKDYNSAISNTNVRASR